MREGTHLILIGGGWSLLTGVGVELERDFHFLWHLHPAWEHQYPGALRSETGLLVGDGLNVHVVHRDATATANRNRHRSAAARSAEYNLIAW